MIWRILVAGPPGLPMSSVTRIKQQKRTIVDRHIEADNVRGFAQALATLAPLAALWYAAALSAGVSYWLTAGVTLSMSLFVLRAFLLMHDCGHGSLFRTASLNKTFGFIFGVVWGMPQYVWSQHHAFHHATNGNWAKYSGPLAIVPVQEYAAMSDRQQRRYQRARSIWLAPFAGFSKGKSPSPAYPSRRTRPNSKRPIGLPLRNTGICSGTTSCCRAPGR